ncbi:hypothetical protein OH76DRAFT_659126 [Lentinus brumalis]|uniref:Uncharacterized protein n=1 Tax=Lentinus brumalis TaxID=2498619 RepID=A0A371D7J1_9APHY|nr:hypothetical protein OH76DRAFT_659126 [Polyporus brumalis]
MMASSRRRADCEHEQQDDTRRCLRMECGYRPGTNVNLPWAAFPPLPANAPVFPSVVQHPRRAAMTDTVPTVVAGVLRIAWCVKNRAVMIVDGRMHRFWRSGERSGRRGWGHGAQSNPRCRIRVFRPRILTSRVASSACHHARSHSRISYEPVVHHNPVTGI